MPTHRAALLRTDRGFTLIELLVTVAIFGVLAAAGLPRIDTRRQDLNTVAKQVVGDLRWARAHAITSGCHFALVWNSKTAYQVQRLKLNGANWVLDTVAKTVTLPNAVSLTAVPAATEEFNTRGMLASSNTSVTQNLTDTRFGGSHSITVWPSGQIYDPY